MTQPPITDGASGQILMKLGEIGADVAVMKTRLEVIPDHENRIRSLEKWKYGLPLATLLAIGSTCLTVWALLR